MTRGLLFLLALEQLLLVLLLALVWAWMNEAAQVWRG